MVFLFTILFCPKEPGSHLVEFIMNAVLEQVEACDKHGNISEAVFNED